MRNFKELTQVQIFEAKTYQKILIWLPCPGCITARIPLKQKKPFPLYLLQLVMFVSIKMHRQGGPFLRPTIACNFL